MQMLETLYVSDLDGTLLRQDATLSDYTCQTINRLVAAGLPFTLATARSVASARPAVAGLRLSLPAIMMNGVFLTDLRTEKHAHIAYLNKEDALRVLSTFLDRGRPPFIYTCRDGAGIDVSFTELRSRYEEDFVAERKTRYRSFAQVADYTVDEHTVYINGIDRPEVILPIFDAVRRLPGVDAVCYPDNYDDRYYFLEAFSDQAGKWAGIRRLAQMYGFRRVVTIGDNLNDMEMLTCADVGVAVENAHPEVLKIADIVIGANQADGVARFLLEEAAAVL